jgi:hypothetical protein
MVKETKQSKKENEMTKPDTYQPTAEQAYKSDRELFIKNMQALAILLSKADANQAKTPKSWGHAGNLGHANEELENLIQFLS